MRISDGSSDVCFRSDPSQIYPRPSMAATVSEVFPHTIPKIRIESKQGNEMSNLRNEFNEALGLIEGQPFSVATVTPPSFFKDAGDRRSSPTAGATIQKENEPTECRTVLTTPPINHH